VFGDELEQLRAVRGGQHLIHAAKEHAITHMDHSASLHSISDDKLETEDPAEDVRPQSA
jgi:hypothetical protein